MDALGLQGDCFTNCLPHSAGGKCDDDLFTDGAISVGSCVSVSDKKFTVTDPSQIKQILVQTYPYATDQSGKSLCEAVKPQLEKYGNISGGMATCQEAVNGCRWVARDQEVKELEATIAADQAATDKIQKQIDAINNREDNMSDSDCADCQASYYGSNQMNTAQKISLITSAFTPIVGMGLNAATTIHGQSEYANEYNTYCGTGLQIGIPCNAPSALTGTFGGGLSSTVYGGALGMGSMYGSAYGGSGMLGSGMSGMSGFGNMYGGGYGMANMYGGTGSMYGGAGMLGITMGGMYGGMGSMYGNMYGSNAMGSMYAGLGGMYGGYGMGSMYAGIGSMYGGSGLGGMYGGYGSAIGNMYGGAGMLGITMGGMYGGMGSMYGNMYEATPWAACIRARRYVRWLRDQPFLRGSWQHVRKLWKSRLDL